MNKRLIIVGAGGLGRIVYDALRKDPVIAQEMELAGFLDTRADLQPPPDIEAPVLGSPLQYQVRPGDIFIPAVGVPAWRRKLLAPLQAQAAEFLSYSRLASIGARTEIGPGVFLTPGAVVSVDCRIGAYAYLDTYVIVGHDVTIGEHCMIGAMSFLAGGVRIDDGVAIHPRATIAKGVHIGAGATVGIGSVVVKDVPPSVTVFGNPARPIFTSDPS